MAWAQFTADFDWRASGRVTIAYRAGMRLCVTRACAEAAIAAGAAVEVEAPSRPEPEPSAPES